MPKLPEKSGGPAGLNASMNCCPGITLRPERNVVSSDRREMVRRAFTLIMPLVAKMAFPKQSTTCSKNYIKR